MTQRTVVSLCHISLPSKLLIMFGEAKSFCFDVSCIPESLVVSQSVSFSFVSNAPNKM